MSRARDTADQINRVNSSAADATAITVDSSENVGIGTSSPVTFGANTHGLTLNGTASGQSITFQQGGENKGFIYNNTNDMIFASEQSGGSLTLGSNLRVSTGGSERIRIDSDGLKFHGDTAAANALNDYEEGTWTPTHTGGSGTGSFSDARYTKIGNTVHIYFAFSFSSGGGSMAISGFPFNCNGNTVGIGREDQTNGYGVYGRINAGDSTVYIYATQASSNASAYQVSSGAIKFAMTYETNS
jgi:hypothetical protein